MIKVLIFLLIPSISLAQGSLPNGKLVEDQGVKLKCFTLEEFKVILKLEADLQTYVKQVAKYDKSLSDYDKLRLNLVSQLASKSKQVKVLSADLDRLTKKWTEENRLRHIAENRVPFTTWIAWGTAGVATAVATVLVIVLAVRD